MGIKGLIPFLNEKVPGSMCELTLESLSGEYVAVDASTALYQFSIAIRDSSYFSSLVNSNGESTSHLYGLMSRSLKLLESGIKPVFVFDSKPPDLKLKTLDKRRQKREEANQSLKQAMDEGDVESIKKLVGRTVKVSKEMNESAKKLLRLMGVPVIEALEEAEAQCAYLVRNNLCRFVASEDTDTLVFGGNFLLRNVTASNNKKILKVDLEKVLAGLDLTFDQFVDFCILCGCDYCDTLEGVGPKTAYSLVKRYDSLEDIIKLKGVNYDDYKEAREYFLDPKVNEYDQGSVKMGNLDAEALTEFLVNENNFSKERVERFIEKLMKLKTKKVQTSLMSFLTQPSTVNKTSENLNKKGNASKLSSTSNRTNNKGTATSRGISTKRQKTGIENVSEVKDKEKKLEGSKVTFKDEKVETGRSREEVDDMGEKGLQRTDSANGVYGDEFFDKLFNLDEEFDLPAIDNDNLEVKEQEKLTFKELNKLVQEENRCLKDIELTLVQKQDKETDKSTCKDIEIKENKPEVVNVVEQQEVELENDKEEDNLEEYNKQKMEEDELFKEYEYKRNDEVKVEKTEEDEEGYGEDMDEEEPETEEDKDQKVEDIETKTKEQESVQQNSVDSKEENVELTDKVEEEIVELKDRLVETSHLEKKEKEECVGNDKESGSENKDQNLDKELELKFFNTKRVLYEDDDMTTATSENLNCDVSDEKKEDKKKGLRHLFDVLVAYPKPTKKQKGNNHYLDQHNYSINSNNINDLKYFNKNYSTDGKTRQLYREDKDNREEQHKQNMEEDKKDKKGDLDDKELNKDNLEGGNVQDKGCANGNITHMVEGVPIPEDLVRFIVIEKFIPYVTFHDITRSSVGVDEENMKELYNEMTYVTESNLFENNKLLLSTRNELNKKGRNLSNQKRMRLDRLTKISYSHGISWESLDNLYFEFYKGKTEAYNSWEENKFNLIKFANQVALKKINDTKSLNEFKKSGKLIKLFTHKYYNRWYNCYMEPFSTGMLIKYLKAHVTMALLNRESQEHTGENLDFKFQQSDKNPYFKELF